MTKSTLFRENSRNGSIIHLLINVLSSFSNALVLVTLLKDEIENPNKNDAINQLEILARRGYFSIPSYTFQESYDKDGNPIWSCECHIKEYDKCFIAKSSSKRNAKKSSAFKMLKFILDE